MPKLYLTMDETTVRISNRPLAPKELPPMERDELIAFIAYLKENVREEDVPHDIRMIGLFNRRPHDFREERLQLLKIIKENEPENAYYLLTRGKKATPFSKKIRELCGAPISYREDLSEYLLSRGIPEKNAERFSELISTGQYKTYCRGVPVKKTLEPVLPKIHVIGKNIKRLPSRRQLTCSFNFAYQLFLSQTKTKEL